MKADEHAPERFIFGSHWLPAAISGVPFTLMDKPCHKSH
jgi:hypothetical protein